MDSILHCFGLSTTHLYCEQPERGATVTSDANDTFGSRFEERLSTFAVIRTGFLHRLTQSNLVPRTVRILD
jgi:hypothetical protein